MKFLQLLEEIGIDVPDVMGRFSGNENLVRRFVCKFPQDPTFVEFCLAYNEDRLPDAERAVHTIKGIAANLSMKKLAAECSNMQALLHEGQKGFHEDFDAVAAEYERIVACVNRYAEDADKDS